VRPPEVLETARLRLRPAKVGDTGFIYDTYARDPEVTRYLAWPRHRSRNDTEAFLLRCEAAWRDGTGFPWTVERLEDGCRLGMLELRVTPPRAALGYVLAKEYWGQGYMPEAVGAVRDWFLSVPSLHRLWAVCYVENHASARVLEKAGFQREGVLRRWEPLPNVGPDAVDCLCYAIVK